MTDLAQKIRQILTYSASLSIMRTFDGQWQVNTRRGTSRSVYGVHTHADPIKALEMAADAPLPHDAKPITGQCPKCGDTGHLYGELNVPCDCKKPFSLPGLPATPVLPGMPGWKG